MNDDNGLLGEIIEQGAAAVAQVPKTAAAQLGVSQPSDTPAGTPPADNATTKDINEALYGNSKPQAANNNVGQQVAQMITGNPAKTPQEQAEMESVRKRLHDEYYQSLVNPPKQEEERPAEKVEREEKQEAMDLQQKEMDAPPPLAVQMGQAHAEKFPGASG